MDRLLAGACAVEITPPLDVPLGSGFNPPRVTGIADRLYARALVLSDGTTRIALACCDILAVDPSLAQEVRRRVAAEIGIPAGHVVVCATHTHSCGGRLQPSRGSGDPALLEILARQVAGAVAEAARRLTPASLAAGAAQVEGVSVNRRDPAAPVDRTLRVLRVDGEAALLAVLTVFACHPTLVARDRPVLSADFPGVLAGTLGPALGPDVVVLPANGACGDVNPVTFEEDGLGAARRIGRILAGAALTLTARLAAAGRVPRAENTRWGLRLAAAADEVPRARPPLRARSVTVRVPYRRFRSAEVIEAEAAEAARDLVRAGEDPARVAAWEQGKSVPADPAFEGRAAQVARLLALRSEAWASRVAAYQEIRGRTHREVPLQALALGPEIAVLAVPFELFSRIGLEIQAASPFPCLLLIGYANDLGGYLMPDDEHPRGGFEAGITFYGPGAAAAVRDAALGLLRALAADAGTADAGPAPSRGGAADAADGSMPEPVKEKPR